MTSGDDRLWRATAAQGRVVAIRPLPGPSAAVEATTLMNIGTMHKDNGDLAAAEQFFERALTIQRQIGDRAKEAATRVHLGLTLRADGRLTEAVRHLQAVVELDQAVERPDLEYDRALLEEMKAEVPQTPARGT